MNIFANDRGCSGNTRSLACDLKCIDLVAHEDALVHC